MDRSLAGWKVDDLSKFLVGTTETVINEAGADIDFRVEGDTATKALVVDAGLDAVQIGGTVAGDIADFRAATVVLNEDGSDQDLRIEGDTATSLVVVDAGLDAVQIGTTVAGALADFRPTIAVLNEPGADVDLRIEGDTATSLVVVDAGLDAFQVGTTVAGTLMDLRAATSVFNEAGADIDLRIEGDTDANLLVLDAGLDAIRIGGTTPAAWLHLKAGTTALASLLMPTGTNLLTTPAAGAFEYDGKIFYQDFAASQRGISPTVQTVYQSATFQLPNNNSLNACFTAAQDTLTVLAATTYFFEAYIHLTTGATTHTTAFGLLGAGGASMTSCNYHSDATSSAAGTLTTPQCREVEAATAAILTATSIAVRTKLVLYGSFQTTNGGTIIPSIQFSADPTGTCTTNVGSFFRCWPAGTNTMTSVGPWA